MDRERLDGWCERGILGLVLALLIYSPLALGSVRLQEFVVVEWLTVAVLVVWVLRFWINPKHRLLWPPVCWAVLAFMGYAVARYYTADIEFVARQELVRILIYGFLFYAILNNLHRLESTQIVALTLIFVAMAISLYALYQFLTDSEFVWSLPKSPGYRKRATGTFLCPNHLAGYLEMLLPLSLAYTLTGRFNHVMKILLGYASLAMFTGIVVTVSRGGWLACGLSLIVLFVVFFQQRDYRLQGLLAVGAFALIASVFFLKARLSHNRQTQLTQAAIVEDGRLLLWKPAIRMWQDHFWWGIGPGHFDYRFRGYRPETSELQWRPERVHNDYLNTLADWGTLGFLLVATAWGLFYWGVFRSWKYVQRSQGDLTSKRSNKSSLVLGGAVGLLAVLLHSVVDFNMHIPSNAILAVTLTALVVGHFRFATESHWQTVRWPLKLPTTAVLLAGLVFLTKESWQRTEERHWLAKAKKAKDYSSEQVAALQKAMAADNTNFETAYQIGEALRVQSWQGEEGYQEVAKTAMKWFQRSMELNRFDPAPVVRYGSCLDWIGQRAEAAKYFQQAVKLDPHGYYTLAWVGWHHVQTEEYNEARQSLKKSLYLNATNNPIANNYMRIVEEKLAEKPAAK
jgi:O-antigen ligase